MRRTFAALLLLLMAAAAAAQEMKSTEETDGLPKLLLMDREELKPGTQTAHDQWMRTFVRTASTNGPDLYWIGARPITGNTNELFFISLSNSYADLERDDAQLGKVAQISMTGSTGENPHAKQTTYIARLRPELSYGLSKFDIAQAKYWDVSIVRNKPGTDAGFEEDMKEVVALHKNGGIEESWAVYRVNYGASTPTYLLIYGYRSMADMDNMAPLMKQHEAVFTPSIMRRYSANTQQAELSAERILLKVRPDISRPMQSLVAANPDFWTVKEEPVVATKDTKKKPKGTMSASN